MKIVADENIPLIDEFFSPMGTVVRLPGRHMKASDLAGAEVLLVRSVTRVNAGLLAESNVGFVGTCTIGVDHLDKEYLASQSIGYASAPGCNATSVVEYVYAALCELDTDWLNCRVGIIGCGNVGGLLHRRLRAQGVECRCYDPFLTTDQNADLTSLEEVLACDVISLHTPLTTTGEFPSFHLLGAAELALLKENAIVLNCGRGPVIDNQALLALLKQRKDLRIVLDVWEPEPVISRELLRYVAIGTPHIAGYSYDGKLAGTEMIYQALCQHLQCQPERSIQALVPPLKDNQLTLPEGDTWVVIKSLIKQVYDLAADDRALRDLAEQCDTDDAAFALGFDGLRKHYPMRREMHNYRVALPTATVAPELVARLQAIGFVVGE